MNTPSLQRLTTRYQADEDRLCLTGELPTGHTVPLWLTQRLCLRLLPCLLDWLNAQSRELRQALAWQGVAQQAATAALTPSPPVLSDATPALVNAVDVTWGEAVTLRFRHGETLHATVSLDAEALRQWLGIMHMQWQQAGWPSDLWPAWMRSGTSPTPAPWLH